MSSIEKNSAKVNHLRFLTLFIGFYYNRICLWQVLGAGGLINKCVAHVQDRKYVSEDIFMTGLCWYFLDI